MRYIILLAIFAVVVTSGLFAQTTDDFTITVTVNYIEFQLKTADNTADYTTWPIGNVNEGETVEMTTGAGGDHIYVNNESNVALQFSAYSTSPAPGACGYGTATAWSPGAAAGVNIYRLEMDKGALTAVPGAYTTITATTLGGADDFYNTAAGESYHLYTKFTVPTTADDGCQHNITVYVVATTP